MRQLLAWQKKDHAACQAISAGCVRFKFSADFNLSLPGALHLSLVSFALKISMRAFLL
jgi:hypothetical protein